MLVLLDGGVASVVPNQILHRRKPLLALPGNIILTISTGNLVVEDTELLVSEGEDEASGITLTPADQVAAWFSNTLQPHARTVSADIAMVPPRNTKSHTKSL